MATTLADVAERAGVSKATASRVLNNKMVMPIPPTTVERIRRAASELDYRPNALARALVTGRTHALGVLSQEMADPHFAQMLEAVEAAAMRLGYHIVVSSSWEAVSRPGRIDGILVVGLPDETPASLLARAPAVFVNGTMSPRRRMIGWSDADGMRLAVRHLADLGHRSIAGLFCYGAEPHPAPPKVIGFLDACRERGIEGRPIWSGEDGYALRNDLQFANGYAAASAFVRDGCDCTAMVARNDFIAMGALRALREAGLAAPRDVSLVGYTDSMLATCAIPPLTSVRTPFAEAGAMAIEHLVQAVNGDRADREGVMLPVSLTVRASTGPPLRREKRRLHAARPYDDRKEEPRHAHAHRKSAQDGLPETTS